MKFQFLAGLAALSLLIACGSSNPLDGSDVTPPSDETAEVPDDQVIDEVVFNLLPESIGGNLKRITFDPTAEVLRVDMEALDASPALATYLRSDALDFNDFLAYAVNEGALHRTFTALARQSDRGTVLAAVVADGGQFNRRFGGGYYARLVPLTIPEATDLPNSNLVSYAGHYVGLLTPGVANPNPNIPPEVSTSNNHRVSGQILIDASFSDMAVNGGIYNRQVVETGEALEPIALTFTEIRADGSFLGTVEFMQATTDQIGNYGGTFAGPDASDVAGVLLINPVRNAEGIWENGAFVLGKCGLAGEGALCAHN
ncbi:MAG: hypothetical protein WDA25_08970 [Paracoccaceae bacterium]